MARPRSSASALLTLAGFVVAIAALHLAKEILLPLALAVLISFLLTPLANRLERWRAPRRPGGRSGRQRDVRRPGALGWVVTRQLADLGKELPRWRVALVHKVEQIKPGRSALDDLSETIEEVDKAMSKSGEAKKSDEGKSPKTPDAATEVPPAELPSPDVPRPERSESPSTEAVRRSAEGLSLGSDALYSYTQGWWRPREDDKTIPEDEAPASRPVDVRIVGTPVSPMRQMLDWFGPLMAPITTAGVAIVLVIFILLSREDQRNRLLQLFGSTHLHASTEALTDVTERVSKYLRMQFLINAGYGVAVGLGLWFIGVPSAVMWGVLSFSLRFLPYVGPWLSAVMPLFVSIADSEGWTQPIMVIGWFTILELVVNNVAEPLLYGRSTGVSGVGVIVAALFWTWIWGPIGLVMAMPLTVCVVVMAKYIPALQFLDVLLGDRPPMADEQRVYQRLLAGDVDEARKVLLARLRESNLTEVYDAVLVPALTLAERDRHGGLLHQEQEDAVEETARELIEELGEAAESIEEPAAPAEPIVGEPAPRLRVLCAPLRDEADEISAQMLSQLFKTERVEIELAANESLTGELVDSIAELKIDVALISILPPLSPRSSRLLCRRLRERYPKLPIIVGYWCGECPEDIPRRLCADDGEVVTTLSEAVERVRAIVARPRVAEKVG